MHFSQSLLVALMALLAVAMTMPLPDASLDIKLRDPDLTPSVTNTEILDPNAFLTTLPE